MGFGTDMANTKYNFVAQDNNYKLDHIKNK